MWTLEHLLAWPLIYVRMTSFASASNVIGLCGGLKFTMAAPSIKMLSAWGSSVGKPHYSINKQPQINTTWSFTLKRMSLLHCPFGDIWMVAKHLQLCNGQVGLASIIFPLGLYIETIFNHFHRVKQRRWYAWLNFVCWKWSHELWFMLLQVFSYYFSFLCHVNSVTIVTCQRNCRTDIFFKYQKQIAAFSMRFQTRNFIK